MECEGRVVQETYIFAGDCLHNDTETGNSFNADITAVGGGELADSYH